MSKSPAKLKQWLSLFVGTVVTLVLLSWVLRDVDWWAVWHSLGRSHWGWFGLGWGAYIVSYGVRAHRWGVLLAEQGYVSTFRQRLTALFIGFGANSVLPASLGEVLRAGLLHRSAGVPLEASLGSIFAERMLDIGIVLLLLVLPLMLRVVPAAGPGFSFAIVLSLCILLVVLWGLCLLGARQPTKTIQILDPALRWIKRTRLRQRLRLGILHFLGGLSALSQPGRCFILLLETLCAWLLNGVTYWTGLLAFQEYAPGFMGALFIQSGTALAIAIPSTPGYLGPFEASLQLLLGLYHIPAETILSYAIALRFLMYVTIPIIAAVLAIRLGWPSIVVAYKGSNVSEKGLDLEDF